MPAYGTAKASHTVGLAFCCRVRFMVVDNVFCIRVLNVLFALHSCVSFTWVGIFHFSHRLGNSGASIMSKTRINAITSLASGHQCELLESAYKLRGIANTYCLHSMNSCQAGGDRLTHIGSACTVSSERSVRRNHVILQCYATVGISLETPSPITPVDSTLNNQTTIVAFRPHTLYTP
jgi:hypothetical protein